uniref:Tyrosine 3-monooxygenase n=1 Tax=Sipha flava TaxID=143950 RepID=A0A2S2R6X3_9HEMI
MAVAAAQKSREMFAINKSYSIENGYPARRRSLVDDARFETIVVKQTKQSVLEEARQLANVNDQYDDQGFESEEKPIGHENEVESSESSEPSSSDNDDSDAGLTEEEVLLEKAASQDKDAEMAVQRATLVLRLREGINSLARVLKVIENGKGNVVHLESRPSKEQGVQFDVLAKVDMTRKDLLALMKILRQSSTLASITILAEDNINVKNPWFPRHARDLDNCNHLVTKYEPELDMNHPGFADKVYRSRRKEIAAIAFEYKYGDSIPYIDYTADEVGTWTAVFNNVLDLMPKHFCMEYRNALRNQTFRLIAGSYLQ